MTSRLSCLAALTVVSLAAPGANSTGAPGRLLVQFRTGIDQSRGSTVLARHWARIEKTIEPLGVFVMNVPDDALDEIAAQLEMSGAFNYVERDYVAHSAGAPNDPSFRSEWHLAAIHAADAWNITTGAPGAPIAIIDSGIDATHPDLADRITTGWNFLSGSADTSDVFGHGTAVAGTAAAATNNGIGVAGVSWNNPIMPLVVLNANDSATYSDIARAIIFAADRGVRIINVSVSGTQPSMTLQNAINYAWSKGSIVFAAAGNGGSEAPSYPAGCSNVVAVAATDATESHAPFSNYGSWITLAAPGKDILTTTRGGGYAQWYGTSFAAPIVASVAALVLSIQPLMSNPDLVSLLERTSDDLGAPGFDPLYGWGRVNAYRALSAAAGDSTAEGLGAHRPHVKRPPAR
jgi:subtilisin family serine protease